MGQPQLPLDIVVTFFAALIGALSTLAGVIYRRLQRRLQESEEAIAELEAEVISLRQDLSETHQYIFGYDEAPGNGSGIFGRITEQLAEAEARQEALAEQLETVVDELHDNVDGFDREDIEE